MNGKQKELNAEPEVVEFHEAPFVIRECSPANYAGCKKNKVVGYASGVVGIRTTDDPFFLLKFKDGRQYWLYFNPVFWEWLWSSIAEKTKEKGGVNGRKRVERKTGGTDVLVEVP